MIRVITAILCVLMLASPISASDLIVVQGRKRPVASAPAGNTFAVLQGAINNNWGASVTATLNGVNAGSLVVVYATVARGSAINAITVSDGTSSLTASTAADEDNGSDYRRGQFFYILSSVASGNLTYTASSTGASQMQIVVYEVSHTAAATLDQHNEASLSVHAGGDYSSGNITTTAGGITFGGSLTTGAITKEQINGSNMDAYQAPAPAYLVMGYSIIAGTYTGNATFNAGDWVAYVANVINFK